MLNTCFLDLLEVVIEGFTSTVQFCAKLIITENYEFTQNERRGMLSWRKLQGGPIQLMPVGRVGNEKTHCSAMNWVKTNQRV